MGRYNTKSCEVCASGFLPTGAAARFCSTCASIKKQESRERDRTSRRTGIGSGNHPLNRGETHSQYTNGIGMYKKMRDEKLKDQVYLCNRCAKSLASCSPHHRCGHHVDHDRTNNSYDNIEVICKSCHQREHNCWENFKKGATTIPKGSRGKCSEAVSLERE